MLSQSFSLVLSKNHPSISLSGDARFPQSPLAGGTLCICVSVSLCSCFLWCLWLCLRLPSLYTIRFSHCFRQSYCFSLVSVHVYSCIAPVFPSIFLFVRWLSVFCSLPAACLSLLLSPSVSSFGMFAWCRFSISCFVRHPASCVDGRLAMHIASVPCSFYILFFSASTKLLPHYLCQANDGKPLLGASTDDAQGYLIKRYTSIKGGNNQ